MAASSIVINTNSFCEEDLTTFLECSERIQKCEERQRGDWLKKAILTNQEIFETSSVSAVTDDDLIKRNEGEQSFISRSASMEDLLKYFEEDVQVDSDQDAKKLERNIEVVKPVVLSPNTGAIKKTKIQSKAPSNDHVILSNIKPSELKEIRWQSSAPSGSYSKTHHTGQLDPMRKFVKLSDLDLIDQNSSKGNPPKRFSSSNNDDLITEIIIKPSDSPKQNDLKEYGFKSENLRSILNGRSSRANHEHLKPSDLNLTMKEWEERYFKIIRKDLKPQDLNLTQKEWDERYYQIIRNDLKPVEPIPSVRSVKSPQQKPMKLDDKPSKWEKALRPPKKNVKSKVQKIAEMFNGMITQVMKNDQPVSNYERFTNELSPEPVAKPPQPKIRTKLQQVHRHTATPKSSPKPTPRSSPKLSKRPITPTGCLIPEEVFNKLSVKDKALLFNKFMREMSRQNPDFTVDPEEFKSALEKKKNSEITEPMVLTEKQESVMNLARELEAKIMFPKQTISPAALVKTPSKKGPAPQPPVHENIERDEITGDDDSVHVSKLTVVLKPSPNKPVTAFNCPVLRRKITTPTVVVCPSMKRTNHQISSSVPIEIYAPPRKIRRTRPERSNSKKFTQNPNLEQLFYGWMKDRHGLSFDIQTQDENTSQEDKSQEGNAPAVVNDVEPEDNDKTIETDTTLKNDELEVEVEPTKKEEAPMQPTNKTSKNDPSESDSSLITMPSSKVNTDESQTDQAKESPDADFDFVKPVRPPRKKKVRRATLTWKKDASIVEKLPLSTTDSDSDFKQLGPQLQQKPKKPTTLVTNDVSSKGKKLIFKDSPSPTTQNSFEVDDAFLDFMNSPTKIRNAYTLTVMSSPSQKADSVLSNTSEAPAKPPRKGKASITQLPYNIDESKFENEDQGFETGSTGYSPARIVHKTSATFSVSPAPEKSPLFIKLNSEMERRMSGANQTPSAYSTPVKNNSNISESKLNPTKKQSWHTVFSPIQTSGSRRRSLADSESRRSSIVMDVIREEQHQQSKKPESPTVNDDVFFSTPSTDICRDRKSSFWISIDDLTLSMDIFGNPKDRLSLLSDIFGQKSGESKNVHFGIDDLKYSPKEGAVSEEITKNLPKVEGISYYWFASGDLAVPFQGNFIAPERVKEIFNFICNSSSSSEQHSFGVDDIEFSKIPEPASPCPKFSIESSYSMLIGLNGKSNEQRNKFTWPASSRNSTPFKTSDFDPSEFDSDSFEVSEIGRLSFSPYGSNYFDMASMQSGDRTSIASYASMGSPEMFTSEYENEPLDKMFGTKKTNPTASSPTTSETFVLGKNTDKSIKMPKLLPPTDSMTVDKMIETIRKQQHKLQNLETDMKTYTNPAGFTSSVLDKYHGRPYVRKLHNIVRSIQIIAKTGFENCTAQQLESFLYFLSLYAETCLSSCSNQMNVILEQLRKDKSVQV
ncbi:uncharacterized protein LOC129938350 [Eupeodes corollae]|uniref:uncharacterized protein LOC129938350 n=1 Tax=Eupeodes corollae TaxID=290404 RepID=UPI002492799B|nr:uncharacterized protein LOC129938350 [Eupeodes corollae]